MFDKKAIRSLSTTNEPNLRKNIVLTTGIKPLGVRATLDAICCVVMAPGNYCGV
jgi:hypothetical protein